LKQRDLPTRLDKASGQSPASFPIIRDPTPAIAEPALEVQSDRTGLVEQCRWVWYPEGNPAVSAPPGRRYFRKQIALPTDRRIKKATFVGTADNSFALFINAKPVESGDQVLDNWHVLANLDIAKYLQPGLNQLAIEAANATDQPNPAGLIGRFTVEFEQGQPLDVRLDTSWKASKDQQSRWREAGFDDSKWTNAAEVARFGGGPWGRLSGRQLTLSPVKADPFYGHCEVPATVDLAKSRMYLEMSDLAPEAAARITVNDQYAGGLIGKPFRLDVTKQVRSGRNSVRIEPFAPHTAQLVCYPR